MTVYGGLRAQNYFQNNTKTFFAFFILIFFQVYNGVFQRATQCVLPRQTSAEGNVKIQLSSVSQRH